MRKPMTEVRCSYCGAEIMILTEEVPQEWGRELRVAFTGEMCDCFWKHLPKHILDELLDEVRDSYDEYVRDSAYAEALRTVDQDMRDQLGQAQEDAEMWQSRFLKYEQKYEAVLLAAAKAEEELAELKEEIKHRPFLI